MRYKCDKCGKEFKTKTEAESHEKKCKGIDKDVQKEKLLEMKKGLIKKINDHNQTKVIGIIIAIFFCWTVLGLILGIILAIHGSEKKRECQQELAEVDYKLSH